MSNRRPGTFFWYELMTTDVKGAIAFYGEVVGWKTQAWEGGDYTMWLSSQGPLGGVMTLQEQAKKMGAPPHWMVNVEVSDVDATVAKVKELGGQVHVPPTAIPKIGRFSVIADPQGATIAMIQPEGDGMPARDTKKQGEFCWSELLTTDMPKAFDFYSAVFGWELIHDHDMGPEGKYRLYGKDGKDMGGMFTVPESMRKMPPAFMHYIQVDDLDAALERAKKQHAKVLNGPMEVPGGARIVQLMDPQGAAFALHALPKKG